MVVTALCLAVVATVGNEFVVGAALLPVGGSWIAVMSSLNSSLQMALPNWVRARGLAYYLVVFQGAQALAAVVWGTVADHTSVTVGAARRGGHAGRGRGGRAAQPDAGHHEAGPDPVGALAGPAADVHAGRRRRPGAGHADLRRARGERRGVHRGDGPRRPVPAAHGSAALGAVPRRRRPPPGSSSRTSWAPGPSTCASTSAGSPAPTAGSRSRPTATRRASRRSPTCSRPPSGAR